MLVVNNYKSLVDSYKMVSTCIAYISSMEWLN